MLKIIQNFESETAAQPGDILVRIINKNKFVFSKFISQIFNFFIDNDAIPNGLKKFDIKTVYKKDNCFEKSIADQLVYYQYYRKLF